jgi:hypothetical protein
VAQVTTRSYNGFPAWYRKSQARIVWRNLRTGEWYLNEACDACGRTVALAAHSEDYSQPSQFKTLCRACHRAIHLRFWRAEEWRIRLAQADVNGWEPLPWVRDLSMTRVDLAAASEHFQARLAERSQDQPPLALFWAASVDETGPPPASGRSWYGSRD